MFLLPVGEMNVEECQLSAVGLFRTDVEKQPMRKKCAYSSEVEPNSKGVYPGLPAVKPIRISEVGFEVAINSIKTMDPV